MNTSEDLFNLPGMVRKAYQDLAVGEEFLTFVGNRCRRCRVVEPAVVEAESPGYVVIGVSYKRRGKSIQSLRFCKGSPVAVFPDRVLLPVVKQVGRGKGINTHAAQRQRAAKGDYGNKILAVLEFSGKGRTLPELLELLKVDYPGIWFVKADVKQACRDLVEAGQLRERKQGSRLLYAPLLKLAVHDPVVENPGSPNCRYGWVEQFLDYEAGESIMQLPVVQFIDGMRCLTNSTMLELVCEPHVVGQIEAARRAMTGETVKLPAGMRPVPWYLLCQLRWNDRGRPAIDEEVIVEIAKHLGWVKSDYEFIGRAAPLIRNQVLGHLDRYYPDWRTVPLREDVPEYVQIRRKCNRWNRQSQQLQNAELESKAV